MLEIVTIEKRERDHLTMKRKRSIEEVRLGLLLRRMSLDSTLSRRAAKGKPSHIWKQYFMQGQISPTYN